MSDDEEQYQAIDKMLKKRIIIELLVNALVERLIWLAVFVGVVMDWLLNEHSC